MELFREDNTEGYTETQLAELNQLWRSKHSDLDPDSDEGKHAQERLLAEFDSKES